MNILHLGADALHRIILGRGILKVAVLLPALLLVAASHLWSPPAHAFGAGTKGWCGGLPPLNSGLSYCSASPADACQKQFDEWAWQGAVNIGPEDSFRWDAKSCAWDRKNAGGPAGSLIGFECEPGYLAVEPGSCVKEKDRRQTNEKNQCGGFNNGGNIEPVTGNPIDITTGNKTFSVKDFETADGSLSLVRRYNSRPHMGATNSILSGRLLGVGTSWRFAFQHEFHLHRDFPDSVEFESSGGGSYPFQRQGSGQFEPLHRGYDAYKQTDYSVEYVGTWPANMGDLFLAPSQWKVRDPEDNVWLFQTFLDRVTNKYRIGRPISLTRRDGHVTTFTYGTSGQLTTVTDPYGKSMTFEWSFTPATGSVAAAPLAVTSVSLPDNTKFAYIFDTVTSYAEPATRLIRAEHRSSGNALLDATTYLYENADFVWFVTGTNDKDGVRRWTVEYDNEGRAITSKGPLDADKVTVGYGVANEPSMSRTVTNALGKNSTYNYNFGSWTVYLTGIDGAASANCPASAKSYTVNSDRMIQTSTDEEGRITYFTRDAKGRATQTIEGYGTPSAKTTTVTYHSTLNVPTQTALPGLTTNYTWDASGRLTHVSEIDTTSHTIPYSTNGQTRTTAYTYNAHGALLTVDGPLAGTGDTTTYTYTTSGYLATVTNEVGHVTTVSAVNGRGLPTTIADPNNVQTALTYDSEGRLKTMTVDVGGLAALTTIDYNAVGDVTKVTRPNGAFLQYTYDAGRRVTKVEDNSGAYAEFDRDKLGNATARRIKDAGGTLHFTQTAAFDELGRLLRFIGASNQTWTHAYDKTSNRVSVTDPRSNVFGWSFDSVNRLIGTSDEETNTVNLTRNGRDKITNYNDPRSLNTSFVRNGFGDVIQRISPDSGTTVYSYNAAGMVTQITDGRGVTTNLTYDNAKRLLTKQYPAATSENMTYTWDSIVSGNKGKGRLTRIQDASGSIEWTYNALGQVAQEKKTTGSAVYNVGYAYDLDGNITLVTYPSGRTVTYGRAANGLVTSVATKKDAASASVTLASGVNHRPFGPLQSLTYGNGLILWKTFTQDYNPNTLIVEKNANAVLNRGYSYWYDDFNITNVWENLNTARTDNYVYTPNNRLQNVYGSWGEATYWQDSVGNRVADIFNNGSTTTTKNIGYPYNNNLISEIVSGSSTLRAFTHDGAGNMITDVRSGTSYNYRYNKRGRLDRLTVGTSVKADYSYDGLERMSTRTTQNMTPASTTHYVYDRSGRLIAESSGTGSAQKEYIWIDDMPLAMVADIDTATPKLWYIHPDHLNRPAKMTDGGQVVVWDAYYWPFGETRSITGSATNNLRFPGQYFLVESGLHYNWHRHFDPTTGRYIQPDPHGFIDGPSIFAYAKSSPVNYVDFVGRNAVAVGAAGGGVLAGPPGALVGAIIGGVATWYGGKWILNNVRNPWTGDPGSEEICVRPDGDKKQTRRYGDDGFPVSDTDWDHDHGQGKPHVHDWGRPPGGGPPTADDRGPGRPPEPGDPGFPDR